jgi:hypothetical protein
MTSQIGELVQGSLHQPGTWTFCAREGEQCNVPAGGTNAIMYTQNINATGIKENDHGDMRNPSQRIMNMWVPGRVSIPCNNTLFGDPAPNVPKLCYYSMPQLSRANAYKERFIVDEETNQYNTLFYILIILVIGFLVYIYMNKK